MKRDTLMSEQDVTPASTKPRRSRQANNLNGTQKSTLLRPTNNDKVAWNAYWKAQDQPWRWEPEIDEERQRFLSGLRNTKIVDPVLNGPFKGITLSRADVEWLLATHEDERGPVDWDDEQQRKREGLQLYDADLRGVDLSELPLAKIDLSGAQLDEANLTDAQLEEAFFSLVQMKGAKMGGARLRRAKFWDANLEGASLFLAELEEADFWGANLRGVNLSGASMDLKTKLANVHPDAQIRVADVLWNGVPLTRINWEQVPRLGDEYEARQQEDEEGRKKKHVRQRDYQEAARAYRQLATVLRNQGLNEEASRFAYRAQLMQRVVLRMQRKFGQYIFSHILSLLSGYGYKWRNAFLSYLFVIGVFAAIYYHIGPHLAWYESMVISMTAFHGRGFFPSQFNPGDPQAIAAAIEALVGLFIEITLIATLTQRLFGK